MFVIQIVNQIEMQDRETPGATPQKRPVAPRILGSRGEAVVQVTTKDQIAPGATPQEEPMEPLGRCTECIVVSANRIELRNYVAPGATPQKRPEGTPVREI